MPRIGKAQYTVPKAYRKRTVKVGGQTRFTLQNPAQARLAARGITTRLVRSGAGLEASGDYLMGEQIKRSMLAMAARASLPDEQVARLEAMDPAKIDWMYHNNRLLFERFFDYSGINFDAGRGYTVAEDSKIDEVEEMLNAYDRLFGS